MQEIIEVCKRIRRLAKENKLVVKGLPSERNKPLLNYLEYIGLPPRLFALQYLAYVQPFMISRTKVENEVVCNIDGVYSMTAFIDGTRECEELVVVFAERNSLPSYYTNKRDVSVITGDTLSRVNGTNRYVIAPHIPVGLHLMQVEVGATLDEADFTVDRVALNAQLKAQADEFIAELHSRGTTQPVEVFSRLQQVSYTTEGNSIFSNISKLIDEITITASTYMEMARADAAMVLYLQTLQLTKEQHEDLAVSLGQKYQNLENKAILQRVADFTAAAIIK